MQPAAEATNPGRILTIKECGALLNNKVHLNRLRRLCHDGEIECAKLGSRDKQGGRYLVPESSLWAWFRRNSRRS